MNNRLRVNIEIIGSGGNSPHYTTTNTHTNTHINYNTKLNNHKTNNQNTQNTINTNINSNNTRKTYGKQRQFKKTSIISIIHSYYHILFSIV